MLSSIHSFIRYHLTSRQLAILLILIIALIFSLIVKNVSVPQALFDKSKLYISHKISVISQIAIYSYKVTFYDSDNSAKVIAPINRVWVNIEGFTSDGQVVIRLWGTAIDNSTTEVSPATSLFTAELADIEITDINAAALVVNAYIRKQVEVDYYRYVESDITHDSVVIWLDDGSPLNKKLVDDGLAIPHARPPTNIINQLMLSYYMDLLL